MSKLKNLIGMKFGKLTVIERRGSNKNKRALWKCNCDCGRECIVVGGCLLDGRIKSCGCLKKDRAREMGLKCVKHGHYTKENIKDGSPTYNSWYSMRQRCNKINHHNYPLYGGRGINVCDEWNKDFRNFLKDMGIRPKGYNLDRINSDGNYEPSNCRWANPKVQASNRHKEIYIKNLVYDTTDGFSIDITSQNNVIL